MSSEFEPVVKIENLGKCYRSYQDPQDRLKQAIWGRRRPYFRETWAVRNVSFELEPGETLGIVGRNGSGKSTVLQMIAGTLTPSEGLCKVDGRIGALLELGSGFNPEFTGIENIYLSASLCGFGKRETSQQLSAICEFAEIGDFVEQPIKTYSSGMVVRLAFAIQAQLRPELLIVDEALAVGDELFQKKCYDHIRQLKNNGTAIILVTHNCSQVLEHCDRAILLHQGKQWYESSSKNVVAAYQRLMHAPTHEWEYYFDNPGRSKIQANTSENPVRPSMRAALEAEQSRGIEPLIPSSRQVYPHGSLEIEEIEVIGQSGAWVSHLLQNTPIEVRFRYLIHQPVASAWFGCHLASTSGQRLSGQRFFAEHLHEFSTGEKFILSFFFQGALLEGTYFVGGGCWTGGPESEGWIHRIVDGVAFKVLARHNNCFGMCDLTGAQPQLRLLTVPGNQDR